MAEHQNRVDSYLTLLCQLYEAADGVPGPLEVMDGDGNAGLSPGQLFPALSYLEDHDFIEVQGTKGKQALIRLTLTGVECVETRLAARVDTGALERRCRDRARFLESLYEMVEGNHLRSVSSIEVASKLGLPVKEVDLLAHYWDEDGGAEVLGCKGDDWLLAITPQGVDDVEELDVSLLGTPAGSPGEVSLADLLQSSDGKTSADNVFLKQGDTWIVGYSGALLPLGDSKGMRYLAFLISHPNRSFTAANLFEAVEQAPLPGAGGRSSLSAAEMEEAGLAVSGPSDAGPVIDRETQESIRGRILDLNGEEEEARERNDPGAAGTARVEREQLEEYLLSAIGLRGRLRRANDDYGRIRQRVYMNIHRTLTRLQAQLPGLHTHLENSIKTAPLFVYKPDRDIPWST